MYAFSPHPSTPPQLNPPPSPLSTLPLGFVHVSFIVVPVIPSSHCPRPPFALAIVRLFLTSMSLVIFCLLFSSIDYVPKNYGIFTQWNSTQQRERSSLYPLQQREYCFLIKLIYAPALDQFLREPI